MEMNQTLKAIAQKILNAKSILLTTHKQCDGDGLGSLLSLYHALKKVDKVVRIVCVDEVARKYSFLEPQKYLETFEGAHTPIESTDLTLVFDTNDRRLVEPLYTTLEKQSKEILFIDHHPVLSQGPEPTKGSYVNTSAASTGEIAFALIKELNIPLDEKIAKALYTSIVFDTQLFKFVKNSSTSHLIAAELLNFVNAAEDVHRHLFSTYTIGKVAFLSKVLGDIEYFGEGRIAVLKLQAQTLIDHDLDIDDSRDVIDMIMNITSLQVAALIREENKNEYKLSLRSKGKAEVLSIAEYFQGGGHMFAAGALIHGDYQEIKQQVVKQLLECIVDSKHVEPKKAKIF